MIKSHSLDVVLTRRFANGLTGNAAFSMNRVTENRTVEEYDREPTLWQTNNNGRPWRVTAAGVYELPFGPGKPFLNNPGMLADDRRRVDGRRHVRIPAGRPAHWNNLFFSGDLDDIKKDNPEIALRPDGTFDPTKTWFNIDAGFERDTADQPAAFQKRTFPFRVDGVRGFDLSYLNASFARTFRLGGSPDVPVPPGHSEPAQPAALCQSGHEPDEHELRAGPGGEQQRHEVPHLQLHVPVLGLTEGLRPSDSPTRSLARRFVGAHRSRGSLQSLVRSL